MSSSSPPLIAFELGVGEFRIVTAEAVYQIRVCPELVEAVQAPPAEGAPTFFEEISEELFAKVGKLARKLSVSVEELPSQLGRTDFGATDEQLESAKGQLEEVVKITEKASMSIMDSADQIQLDMEELNRQLSTLHNLDLVASSAQEPGPLPVAAPEALVAVAGEDGRPDFLAKASRLRALLEALPEAEADLAPAEPAPAEPAPAEAAPAEPEAAEATEAAPAPPAEPVTIVRFATDVVFQTLYELCTNEAVKDHIKKMWEAQSTAFDTQAIENALSDMVPTVDEEDGFYNFPIPSVLKSLYAATASEDFRTILKKMNQTAATIFLDTVLPLEGETVELEAPAPEEPEPEAPEEPAAPASATAEAPAPEVERPGVDAPTPRLGGGQRAELLSLASELETLAQALAAGDHGVPAVLPDPALYTSILTRDRDIIVNAVSAAKQLTGQTQQNLTHIMETLSFQDLSGQRIMKVVALISDIQMQLLSILVAANTKIKAHQAGSEESAKAASSEQMAQQEVDRALEKLTAGADQLQGPAADTRLDQDAVNELLAQLGF